MYRGTNAGNFRTGITATAYVDAVILAP